MTPRNSTDTAMPMHPRLIIIDGLPIVQCRLVLLDSVFMVTWQPQNYTGPTRADQCMLCPCVIMDSWVCAVVLKSPVTTQYTYLVRPNFPVGLHGCKTPHNYEPMMQRNASA